MDTTAGTWLPHEITSDTIGTTDIVGWLTGQGQDGLSRLLADRKAVVFRGFGVTPESIEPVLDQVVPNRLPYVHGNSPRTKVSGNLYTSTEYPQEFTISMHNEMSYAHHWPKRLVFFCQIAPASGGATPVLDGELWLASLDDEVREAFAGGIRYVQNLHDGFGFGKSWMDTFETDDRAEVERFLEGTESEWEWGPEGIRIIQHRPATVRHPITGSEVWFNQADQFHPAGLGDKTASELYDILEPDEFPQHATFADGSPIPDRYVEHIQNRGLELAVDVPWQPGDLMLIDNILVAHGRRPFEGSRRVLVAMSD
ncbi:TauD/TfdA family dioxygenase [Plantactinospora sp. S1510]|uniref:TauD/TfdA family dioxygenase n=1 Tax=Plantactinospora alkalitolerans TaxID=2789879 RepID=A0ABS0GZP4_9ACTN|nr:TauD/TfdA family dioxygenase [Plantactinospora alkalitolerans]MBF9131536.1 TauD/TfdA family dioxygenase [Plantactinospora alkalitolerans]